MIKFADSPIVNEVALGVVASGVMDLCLPYFMALNDDGHEAPVLLDEVEMNRIDVRLQDLIGIIDMMIDLDCTLQKFSEKNRSKSGVLECPPQRCRGINVNGILVIHAHGLGILQDDQPNLPWEFRDRHFGMIDSALRSGGRR